MPKTLKETKENPKTHSKIDEKNPTMSLYEQSREERIKENLQRMQKLGIVDLSKELNSAVSTKRTPKHSRSNSQRSTPVLTPGPLRRSSRLQNATPISYVSKTCHQCRNNTLGHRTQCSECNRFQGQFCGDCLYSRYGEDVLEALENPNWICPVCRGICNCYFCPKAKGLFPTGTLYKKISSPGFKSVAYYLFQTERAQTTLEKNPDVVNPASTKRLQNATPVSYSKAVLSKKYKGLEDKNVKLEEGSKPEVYTEKHEKQLVKTRGSRIYDPVNGKTCHQCRKDNTDLIIAKENDMPGSVSKNVDFTEVDLNHFGLSKPQLEEETDNGRKGEEEKKLHHSGNDSNITLESCPKSQKKRAASEPSLDSIASRLRQRLRKGNGCDGIQLPLVNEKSLDVNKDLSNILSDKEKEMPKHMSKPGVDTELQDSDAGRSRQ